MAEVTIRSPEIAAKKLLDRVRQSKGFYIYGVQHPKISPTQAAIQQADSWHRRVSAPETKQKWIENRKAAGDETWLAGILGKGADRWLPGVEFGIGKYLDFANEFFPYLSAGVAKIKSMPGGSLEERIQRAVAMIRHNASFKRKKRAYSLEELKNLRSKVESVSLPG